MAMRFIFIDWAYQGRSSRLEKCPHKRHSDGFEADLSDLHYLITQEIKTDAPLLMIAHSMGGHLGLRYLMDYPHNIRAAGLSTPMFGIYDIRHTKCPLEIVARFNPWWHGFYVPGGRDWYYESRKSDGTDVFSHDPARDALHQLWSNTNPPLQVGNPSVKWVYESLKSCRHIHDKNNLAKIKISRCLSPPPKKT